jgi:CheY-like chemotaxis protein
MTKILLVEDDKSLREIYGVRLLAEGYDIVSAGDGEEALAMAIKERPQLIISDVMMPKISGFDMLDILRSTTETKNIKVIMMTALSSDDQRKRGEQLGADRYLVKSQVGIEDVVRTVHDVLGDLPATAPTPQQTFGIPKPSAVAHSENTKVVTPPSTNTVPAPSQTSQPSNVPGPTVPTPSTQDNNATSSATPQSPPPPVTSHSPTQPQQAPNESAYLPQPTAPFSSPRPASLGDRVIHPLETTANPNPDIGSLMEKELSNETPLSVDNSNFTPPSPPQ